MSDKLAHRPTTEKGAPFQEWFELNVLKNSDLNKGPIMDAVNLNGSKTKVHTNSCGILFKDCFFQRMGTSDNYGRGGSNCVSGTPVCFVNIVSVFPSVFNNVRTGILTSLSNYYIIPLCLLGDFSNMKTFMNDCCVSFVAQKKGDNKHDDTHIANAICSSLASICFHLSSAITLGNTQQNEEQIIFYVEAFRALSLTALSAAKFSSEVDKIMRFMPYVAETSDTFQSSIMSVIFDENPHISIKVKHFSLSLRRFFAHTSGFSTPFTKTNPTGLIGLLLMIPSLNDLLFDVEKSVPELINNVIGSINSSVSGIIGEIKRRNDVYKETRDESIIDVHVINKLILKFFAIAPVKPFLPIDLIDRIYDEIQKKSSDRDIAKQIGIIESVPFVNQLNLTLSGKPCKNYPVIIKSDDVSGTWIPADPREWTGISLDNIDGKKYIITVTPVGIAKFELYHRGGGDGVANFRITAGTDVLTGVNYGISGCGIVYDPIIQKYSNCSYSEKLIPEISIEIQKFDNYIHIYQSGILKYKVKLVRKYGVHSYPLVSFKNCATHIQICDIDTETIITKSSSYVLDPCVSLSEALSKADITE